VINTPASPCEPYEGFLDGPEQENSPPDRAEEDVDRGDTGFRIDKCKGKGEKNPSDHIITNSSSENYDADSRVQELGADENATEYRKGGDGHCYPNEEQKVSERRLRVIDKVGIHRYCHGRTQSEGKYHPCDRDERRAAAVLLHYADIHFEADQEEKEDQTDGGDEVEIRERLSGEDGIGKFWNTTHDGGSEDDAADDLGDDLWLLDKAECPAETLGETDDDEELDEEESDWLIAGVVSDLCGIPLHHSHWLNHNCWDSNRKAHSTKLLSAMSQREGKHPDSPRQTDSVSRESGWVHH